MKPITYYICHVLIAILLFGCVSNSFTITPSERKTPFLSQTSFPSPNPNTPLPVKTVTLTPPAMLNPTEAEGIIRDLLQEATDCDAPCFLGITPDQTTLGEVKNIFTHFGFTLESTNRVGSFEFYGVDFDFNGSLSIGLTLTVQNGIVKSIKVGITPNPLNEKDQRAWKAYAPETLITRYGIPSKVTFDVDRGPSPGYGIAMFFDDVDLIVYYGSSDLGPGLQVCPLLDQVDYIRIWMGKNPHSPPPNDRIPLNEATSLTIEEFSALMTNEPQNSCFIFNSEVFP